jgi:hypothetical protein
MAPVQDVVAIRPLEHGDRWQGVAVAVGAGDALPPRRDAIRRRAEASVEVDGGIDGADDRLERDRPEARRAPRERGNVCEVSRPHPARGPRGEPSARAGD